MDYQGSNVRDFLHANGQVVLEKVDTNYNLRSFTQKEIEDITNGYRTVLGEGGFGCCTEENALTIVMEFICNGNLYNILHCSNANGPLPFPLDKRLDIAIASAEGLSCMHSMYSPVLHGDIKSANILLDEILQAKISDFGIARLLSAGEPQHTRTVIGCIGYMDPLFCQSGILTPKSDVYSFGVVLLEMITRKKAVDGNIILTEAFRKGKKVKQMFDVEIASGKKNIKLLEGIAKLAAECLNMEEKMRPEMVEVADRLRTIRKALLQCKGRISTGTNSGLIRSGQAEDVLPPTPNIPTPVICTDITPPPTISLDELEEITRNFSNDALIGKNLYSAVFFGVLKDGQKSAIKKFKHVGKVLSEVPELLVVSRFKHENVIRLLGYCVEGDSRILAYEYASEGSLHDILHGKKNVALAQPGLVLSWAQRIKIALGAANGLEFLHIAARTCTIHRCIKSSNILLFDNDVANIGGFGVSKPAPEYIEDDPWEFGCRISGYEAPEYLCEGHFSTKSDVYSFGVVLLELLTGRKACDLRLSHDQRHLMTWALPKLSGRKVQQCVDPRLGGDYPPDAAAKMAAIAASCLQSKKDIRARHERRRQGSEAVAARAISLAPLKHLESGSSLFLA